jgi:hypothetical protein
MKRMKIYRQGNGSAKEGERERKGERERTGYNITEISFIFMTQMSHQVYVKLIKSERVFEAN